LRGVRRISAWRVDFREEDPCAICKLQSVAGIGAHDARFFATLKITDLRPACGTQQESDGEERSHQ
jgi:hypothetical protein